MKGPKNKKTKQIFFSRFYRRMQQKNNFEKILKIEGGDTF